MASAMGSIGTAVNAPLQTFDDQFLYKTIEAKAARLGFSIVTNHAFPDGNKRAGMMVMLTFLALNGAERNFAGLALADGSWDDRVLLEWILDI